MINKNGLNFGAAEGSFGESLKINAEREASNQEVEKQAVNIAETIDFLGEIGVGNSVVKNTETEVLKDVAVREEDVIKTKQIGQAELKKIQESVNGYDNPADLMDFVIRARESR